MDANRSMARAPAIFILSFLLFLSTPGPVAGQTKPGMVFGVTPWGASTDLKNNYAPLISHLGKELNMEVEFVVARSYEELSQRLADEAVDIGFFSPQSYVVAKRRVPDLKYIVSLMKENENGQLSDHYYGIVISLKESGFQTLGDLKNKRFGFTNRTSASGYLYPRSLLSKNGIVPEKFFSNVFMLNRHDKLIDALVNRSIDAGATFDGNLSIAVEKYGDIFREIARTPPIPLDACAAGPHVSDEDVARVESILLEVNRNAELLRSLKESQFPYAGFSLQEDSFYDVVRDLNSDGIADSP